MKTLLLALILTTVSFSLELKFEKTKLNEFKIEGIDQLIFYKSKEERNEKIARLWAKFLGSKTFNLDNSRDKRLYVVYSKARANSIRVFIGTKVKKHQEEYKSLIVQSSHYQKALLEYKQDMDLDDIWEEVDKLKLSRNFKTDMEIYKIRDLNKKSYNITLLLSSK